MKLNNNTAIVAIILLSLSFLACKNNAKSNENSRDIDRKETFNDMHNSQNSLDWQGTYKGVIPCASCPLIEVSLVLKEDLKFEKTDIYQDKGEIFRETGSFSWDESGSIITLEIKDKNQQYKVQEGSLVMLDKDGKRISGDLAKNYILKKTVPGDSTLVKDKK